MALPRSPPAHNSSGSVALDFCPADVQPVVVKNYQNCQTAQTSTVQRPRRHAIQQLAVTCFTHSRCRSPRTSYGRYRHKLGAGAAIANEIDLFRLLGNDSLLVRPSKAGVLFKSFMVTVADVCRKLLPWETERVISH
eukprot:INCI18095.1.p2 GENE.INCI18095.1~~INCI18095.1.p2  ORF type:complete len:137 (-),score=7.29 INCI18095.1:259-669(-)